MPKPIVITVRSGKRRPVFVRIGPRNWRALIEPNGHLFGQAPTRRDAAKLLQAKVDEFYRMIEEMEEGGS